MKKSSTTQLFGVLYNSLRLIRLFSKINETEEKIMLRSGGEFLSVAQWSSLKQGTQHFTDENKVSRK